MSNSCGPVTFMDGGTLTDVHIYNSEFINGYIANSILSNVKITDGVTIDDAAAQALVSQICELIRACVEPIIPKPVYTATPPVESANGILPTTILGNRERLMGEPDIYVDFGDYVVPAYLKA